MKHEDIDFNSGDSVGDTDWNLSPRVARVNAIAKMAKLIDEGKQLNNDSAILPKDVVYCLTNYDPTKKIKLVVPV